MLAGQLGDQPTMIRRGLVICAYACCALVITSFALFARDQISGASKHQVAEIAAGTPTRDATPVSESHHTGVRGVIDSAAHTLTAPFRSVIPPASQWAREIFATLCGLILYGVGLGFLARYSRGLS
jgi:hypothetical protein